MARYKYAAPFDEETPMIIPENAPLPPCPPFPVDIPVDKTKAPKPVVRSLYKDMFGRDLTVAAMALDGDWASDEQKDLCRRLLTRETDINNLSTEEARLLDSLVVRYNDNDLTRKDYQEKDLELVPEEEEEELEDLEEEPEDSSPAPSESITNAYSWIK